MDGEDAARARLIVCVIGAVTSLLTSRPSAHDIPLDVLVRAFVRPQGQHLTLVVRAPMHAMRDINFPRDAEGFLDIPRADAALREAAGTWIAGSVQVF